MNLGNKYLQNEKYEQAVAAFEVAIDIAPLNVDAYLGLADAYTKMEDYDMAESVLEDGIEVLTDEELDKDVKKLQKKLDKIHGIMNDETSSAEDTDNEESASTVFDVTEEPDTPDTASNTMTPTEMKMEATRAGHAMTSKLEYFEYTNLFRYANGQRFDNKQRTILAATVAIDSWSPLSYAESVKLDPNYDDNFTAYYTLPESVLDSTVRDYFGEYAALDYTYNINSVSSFLDVIRTNSKTYVYEFIGEMETDYKLITEYVDDFDEDGFTYVKEIFCSYWGGNHSIPDYRATYTFERDASSSYGFIIKNLEVEKISEN